MNAPLPISDRPEKLRLRVEDFELLEESGAFADRSKAELIDGEIVVLNAQFARHGIAKGRLFYALMKWVEETGSDLHAYSEVSLRVAGDSMPEPDLFLAPRQGVGPVPLAGVVLVIEIADSTLSTDLGRKAELYAAAGIAEYWVIDVEGRRVVMHWRPAPEGYGERSEMPLTAPLHSVTIDGLDLGIVPLLA